MDSLFSTMAFLWHLHAIFGITAFVGGILFISWAMRLKPDQLKQWVKWLLIIGILGALLTSGASMKGWWMGDMMKEGKMMDLEDMKMIAPGERAMNR